MRFSIQREDFLKPLRAVAGVVERHRQTPVNPILGHVLIRVQNQRLSLIATDQEIEDVYAMLQPGVPVMLYA